MNKSKLVQRTIAARKKVRNIGVTLLAGDMTELVDMRALRLIRGITKSEAVSIANDMTEFKHRWSVLLCVFGRNQSGENYIKTYDVSPGALGKRRVASYTERGPIYRTGRYGPVRVA